jgi:hypothetical protein
LSGNLGNRRDNRDNRRDRGETLRYYGVDFPSSDAYDVGGGAPSSVLWQNAVHAITKGDTQDMLVDPNEQLLSGTPKSHAIWRAVMSFGPAARASGMVAKLYRYYQRLQYKYWNFVYPKSATRLGLFTATEQGFRNTLYTGLAADGCETNKFRITDVQGNTAIVEGKMVNGRVQFTKPPHMGTIIHPLTECVDPATLQRITANATSGGADTAPFLESLL